MDYEKKYKEALERAKKYHEGHTLDVNPQSAMEYVFPELKESEDERIRKEILNVSKQLDENTTICGRKYDYAKWISWLEKQGGKEQLYIRFGEIPTDEKSKIYKGEVEVGTEEGVSVYPAFKTDEGNIVLGLSLPITKTTLYSQQHLIEYDNRPCYLVKGDYIGKDADGQPLINNISIIEKIDSYRVKDEKQGEQKETLCDKCKKEQPSHSCQDITELGRCAVEYAQKHNKDNPKFKAGNWITIKQ